MRSHHTVDIGQVWQSSDRRPSRQRLFRIHGLMGNSVIVRNLFPNQSIQAIPCDRFLLTGSKGYTRVS